MAFLKMRLKDGKCDPRWNAFVRVCVPHLISQLCGPGEQGGQGAAPQLV